MTSVVNEGKNLVQNVRDANRGLPRAEKRQPILTTDDTDDTDRDETRTFFFPSVLSVTSVVKHSRKREKLFRLVARIGMKPKHSFSHPW